MDPRTLYFSFNEISKFYSNSKKENRIQKLNYYLYISCFIKLVSLTFLILSHNYKEVFIHVFLIILNFLFIMTWKKYQNYSNLIIIIINLSLTIINIEDLMQKMNNLESMVTLHIILIFSYLSFQLIENWII